MREILRGFACLAVALLCASVRAGATESGLETKLQLDVFQGYDSNPLELSAAGPSGPYTQAAFGAILAYQWNRRAGAFVRAGGSGRSYSSGLSDADRLSSDVEAGLAFSPYRRGDRRLTFAFGGRYGLSRSTFTDPATGEVYVVTPDPNTIVPIPGRFDHDGSGAFLDIRWRVHRRVLLLLDTGIDRRRFAEDYRQATGLKPLDDRSFTVEPGVRFSLTDAVALDFSFDWTDRRFDELDSLDAGASTVEGVPRRYRYSGTRVALRWEPAGKWKVKTGVQRTERADEFAGYYNSTGLAGFVSAEFKAGRTIRLGVDISERGTRYDNATVDSEPGGVRRRGMVLRSSGRLEKDLGNHFTILVELGTDRADDRDPLYQYDRNWAHAGLRLRR